VRALAHPVPRPTGWPSAMVPEAIRSSYVDMRKNLDVFSMFPSISSVGRRFASLHRVLRGEFPCFDGSIKALRHPAARPAALRCLRLAVPQAFTRSVRSPADECAAEAWSWSPGSSGRDFAEETTGSPKFLGNPKCPFAMFSRRRQDCGHQTITVPQRGPWYVKSRGSRERSFDAQ
jgi:hypothetical protein